eukprot:Rmarinus@m.8739
MGALVYLAFGAIPLFFFLVIMYVLFRERNSPVSVGPDDVMPFNEGYDDFLESGALPPQLKELYMKLHQKEASLGSKTDLNADSTSARDGPTLKPEGIDEGDLIADDVSDGGGLDNLPGNTPHDGGDSGDGHDGAADGGVADADAEGGGDGVGDRGDGDGGG